MELAQRSSNTGKVDVRSIVVVVLPTRNCLMREYPYPNRGKWGF
jgi:hypothetical protein